MGFQEKSQRFDSKEGLSEFVLAENACFAYQYSLVTALNQKSINFEGNHRSFPLILKLPYHEPCKLSEA